MANNIEFFWELFESVSGGTGEGVTTVLDSLAKSSRAKVEEYFTNVIDQVSFGTEDYNRMRKFFVDLFATHRTLATNSIASTDPHVLTNSDLDEMFRSFGYPHSAQLRGFDENPLEQKVQFFLDLVNLYKVKGTPQSLVDVLQYYGVTVIDIYEFILKLESPGKLFFSGNAVAGTSVTPNVLNIPYANLTSTDPHWMYTAQQILQLNETEQINLPSQTPYLGVQPVVDLDGAEFSIIARHVQDQYDSWYTTGVIPPPNAEITFIGEIRSLLELYTSTVYMFNKLFETGKEADNFMCYDGTSTDDLVILEEFNTITSPPFRRCDLNDLLPPVPTDATAGLILDNSYCVDSKLSEFYDQFTRPTSSNYLVDENSAGDVLTLLDPTLKAELDSAGEPLRVLYSLLKDLANWVRTNLGFGFINFGFILFGISEFFKDLRPVIEFFKPYRARLLLIEALQIRNRLFNTIIIEDSASADTELEFHDFMTGDSKPCCTTDVEIDSSSPTVCIPNETIDCDREVVGSPTSTNWEGRWSSSTIYAVNDEVTSGVEGDHYICTQAHSSITANKPGRGADWSLFWNLYSEMVCVDTTGGGGTVYSRETYDCGSNHDLGAATDMPEELFIEIEQSQTEYFNCPADGSAYVVSELLDYVYVGRDTTHISLGASSVIASFRNSRANTNYNIGATMRNQSGANSFYEFIITEKTIYGFTAEFSGPMDSDNYYIDWYATDSTNSGITSIPSGVDTVTVPLTYPCPSANYSVSVVISNYVDSTASIYSYNIYDRATNSFKIKLSGLTDSANYSIEWFVCEGLITGSDYIPAGATEITIPLTAPSNTFEYPLITSIGNADPTASQFLSMITEKTQTEFTISFSGAIDSTGYYVTWAITDLEFSGISSMEYYQSGNFRDFDYEGVFDCTHGFDLVKITVEDRIIFMTQEDGDFLLQENGDNILV